ncbi:MAG: hypothetical protein JW995_02615 [Melioribacteraceae bacterium]|nr:hypothetical protein [Melioribacteraceae bacterium]
MNFSINLLCTICLLPLITAAQTSLPAFFSDNMVLQKGAQIIVWGNDLPGQLVKVKIGDNESSAETDEKGNWIVKLRDMNYGGPYEMIIEGSSKIRYKNVMIGEVWLCSGQSNMEMPMVSSWATVNNYKQEVENAGYPDIRLITIRRNISKRPLKQVDTDGWKECSPESVKDFSATGYFFGRYIYEQYKVPIGLIVSSWGGTVIESWISGTSIKTHDDFKEYMIQLEKQLASDKRPDDEAMFDLYSGIIKEFNNNKKQPIESHYINDYINFRGEMTSDWMEIKAPQLWEEQNFTRDGYAFYKRSIKLPDDFLNKDLILSVPAIDDNDIAVVNGSVIGYKEGYADSRSYKIPAEINNSSAIELLFLILDTGYGGGIWGDENKFFLQELNTGRKINLSGIWEFKFLAEYPGPNRPTMLYNAMIHPLIPFAIKGVIWYQGESNAERAYQYRSLMPLLIKDWRTKWQQGNFPFLFVQLAAWKERNTEPTDDDWAELREAQMMSLSVPNTGMAVAIDIGDAQDIHPGNKQDVGRRLGIAARKVAYAEDIVFSGPVFKYMEVKDKNVILNFDHAGSGLTTAENEELKGFAIAGKDKIFYWANARIDGNTVVVMSDNVPEPVAVRYGWSANPECNLYNREGLPASPFRTDDWDGITKENK